MDVKALETRIAQLAQQLEQSAASHNIMLGMKSEAERLLNEVKQSVEKAVVDTVKQELDEQVIDTSKATQTTTQGAN